MEANTISMSRETVDQAAEKTIASGLFGRRLAPVRNTGILFERMEARLNQAA